MGKIAKLLMNLAGIKKEEWKQTSLKTNTYRKSRNHNQKGAFGPSEHLRGKV